MVQALNLHLLVSLLLLLAALSTATLPLVIVTDLNELVELYCVCYVFLCQFLTDSSDLVTQLSSVILKQRDEYF